MIKNIYGMENNIAASWEGMHRISQRVVKNTGRFLFCEKLLLKEKILTVPGNAFGECGEGFIRACYASSMENIYEALRRIERFVKEEL